MKRCLAFFVNVFLYWAINGCKNIEFKQENKFDFHSETNIKIQSDIQVKNLGPIIKENQQAKSCNDSVTTNNR